MCVCVFQRADEEAVVDRGGTRSMLNTNFEKEELEGNKPEGTLYNLQINILRGDDKSKIGTPVS